MGQANRTPPPTQFGHVIGGDFSNDTLTIEMRPRFVVAAGPVAVVPMDTYTELLQAMRDFRAATDTLHLAQQDGVNVHGALSAFNGAREMADVAIAKASAGEAA